MDFIKYTLYVRSEKIIICRNKIKMKCKKCSIFNLRRFSPLTCVCVFPSTVFIYKRFDVDTRIYGIIRQMMNVYMKKNDFLKRIKNS